MREYCKKKTTFTSVHETFQFEIMPFGLMNESSTFQKMMNQFMVGLAILKVYLHDDFKFSKDLTDLIRHVKPVLDIIAMPVLKIKLLKCEFAKSGVSLLGYILDKHGVTADRTRKKAIMELPLPKIQAQLRSFLGIT